MRRWSIAGRLLVGQLLFIVLITTVVVAAAFVDSRDRAYAQAAEQTMAIATTIAASPSVLAATSSPQPSALLQPYAAVVNRGTRVDFVTIMAPDRTRWTHPNPAEVGKPYIGSVDQALAGKPFTEVTVGTLGPSVRSIVPILDASGTVRGMVAVGMTVSTVEIALNGRIPLIVGVGLGLLLLGTLTALLLGRYLRRVTLGWGPERLGQLFSYYESVLHSVRDGLVLMDQHGQLVMYNDQAADLLGIPRPQEGLRPPALDTLDVSPGLKDLLRSGRVARDEIHLNEGRLLVVTQEQATLPGAAPGKVSGRGTVTTLQDHTELERLGDELRSTRTLTDALRAQTHEHANQMHTMASLLELGRADQALAFATEGLALSQQLVDEVIDADREPILSALVMGKMAQAAERGIELRVSWDAGASLEGLGAHAAMTIVGNLLDNALDAAAQTATREAASRWVSLSLIRDPAQHTVRLQVADSGPGLGGIDPAEILRRGFSTKATDATGRGIGLALVQQAVQRLGGTLEVSENAEFTVTLPQEGAS
ncbi:ATP-binding protein [Psychromicrobium xiongbiense]|uniref:sensor histidine kinase n=1 Tax=Psychromicrobium xiongbiense TaxID=3051184 RepID=UPI002556ECFE|nr:ATP-binding protein [Psychromicrobium sp. YIM S02556]